MSAQAGQNLQVTRKPRMLPIEKMGDISLASPLEARIVEKLEELIDRVNAMNER